jgi:hypothetical protein
MLNITANDIHISMTYSHNSPDYWLTGRGETFDTQILADDDTELGSEEGTVYDAMVIDLPEDTPLVKVVLYKRGRPELLPGQNLDSIAAAMTQYVKENY